MMNIKHDRLYKITQEDNLDLLLSLEDKSIDLIYCDILYGTGKDFKEYKDIKGTKQSVEEHYTPRIKEMYRVLKDTGSIYLQMDTRINHWLRCIMDDVFGYDCFKNEICWWYKRWSNTTHGYQKMHDVILFYSKGKGTFNTQYQNYSQPEVIENTVRGMVDGKLVRLKDSDGNYIQREGENKGVAMHDVWELQHLQPTSSERTGYPTQKPIELLKRIILTSSNEGDIVADFYMGSGTTAVVCKMLNRPFIGCDISPNAITISKKRIGEMI
jgi:site-specific DNA-methyltransferase (adenine-specific)